MSNVYVNDVRRNKIARNRLPYTSSFRNTVYNNAVNTTPKTVIEFNTDTPVVADYTIYAKTYGQYPTIEIFTYDEYNNIIQRPEKAYFHRTYDADLDKYLISSIEFGTLSDGVQVGYITIGI
jgi:hypothetical protein